MTRNDHRDDPAVLTGYRGRSTVFEDVLADFGVAYAELNKKDHACLMDAIRSGRLEAAQVE